MWSVVSMPLGHDFPYHPTIQLLGSHGNPESLHPQQFALHRSAQQPPQRVMAPTELPKLGPESPARNVQQLKNGMNVIAALLRNKAQATPARASSAAAPLETPEKPKGPKRRVEKPTPEPKKSPKKPGKGKGETKESKEATARNKSSPPKPPRAEKPAKTAKAKAKVQPVPSKITKKAKAQTAPTVPTVRIVGKGGTKGKSRVFAQLQQNLKGISKPDLRRLARRAGVQRMSAAIMDEMREALQIFLKKTLSDVVVYVEHAKRKTAMPYDVVLSLRRMGRSMYGY
eukprot:s1869_g3.t1